MNRDDVLIEAHELLAKMDDANIRIYDATILFYYTEEEAAGQPTAYEQYQQGHVPGAAFFDHEKFSDAGSEYAYMIAPEADLAAQIGDIGIAAQSEVVVYANGVFPCATRAWWILRYAGHNNVRVLNGGLAAWEAAGGKIEQGDQHYEAATFACRLRPEMFASKEEVLAAMEDGAVCTVNTLSLESYVEAHITGSSCLPCMDLMQEWDSLLPDDTISARLQEEAQNERIITYCGGGIEATVNALAHLIAGNKNVAVYDGSMSEWAGEGLPTTKGSSS